jgi:hypothetical protein
LIASRLIRARSGGGAQSGRNQQRTQQVSATPRGKARSGPRSGRRVLPDKPDTHLRVD